VKHPNRSRVRPVAWAMPALLGTAMLAACTRAPDLSTVQAEAAKPVQRYDIGQAIAANDVAVVAGTQSGAVLTSADNGKTWTRNVLGPVSLIDITTCPDGSFIAVDFYRKVWSADARAAQWTAHELTKPRTPLTVACDKKGQWWVAGTRATIAMSADKGATWKITDLGEDAQITTMQFVDTDFAIAAGEFGMTIASTDGGATWAKRTAMPGEFYPYAVLFSSRNDGWASGIGGQMLHTNDGAKTWTKAADAPAALYRLFTHKGAPMGVGAAGVVARLQGNTWQNVAYPDAVPAFLGGAASLTQQDALVIGGPGGLLRPVSLKNQ
jgi:photosystem II stability/assembly factor-like uncharacterized protein